LKVPDFAALAVMDDLLFLLGGGKGFLVGCLNARDGMPQVS
jgi:hypothetical protein